MISTEETAVKYPNSGILFVFIICLLSPILIFATCSRPDPLSIEGRIDSVEPAEDGRSARISIEGRSFIFTPNTLFVDPKGNCFSGRKNVMIDESIAGRYCLAGWRKDEEELMLLDISFWQQPLFTKK